MSEIAMSYRTLEEMKALNLPRLKAADITEPKEGQEIPAWYPAKLDEYLSHFVKPSEKDGCIRCETQQTDILGALMGGFTWGIAHGEGFCGTCRWPARAYHFLKDDDGKDLLTFRVLLQYHPDELSDKKSEAA
jgi:hypothetical protein